MRRNADYAGRVTSRKKPNPVGRPSKPLLSKTKILDAALELLDEGDARDFSVPMVAAKLGVSPPSIYYYFADRDDLLRMVGLVVMRDLRDLRQSAATDEPRPWHDWVRDYAWAIHAAVRKHPNVVPVLMARKTHGDVADLFEFAVADLVAGGLDADLGLTVLDAAEAVVLGWIAFDQAREPNWGFGSLDGDEYPTLAPLLGRQAPAEERLRQSIEALIAGFEVQNADASRRPRAKTQKLAKPGAKKQTSSKRVPRQSTPARRSSAA
jgi:TetR/AcrR family transcriptional regulator, tetracycline repressor protein